MLNCWHKIPQKLTDLLLKDAGLIIASWGEKISAGCFLVAFFQSQKVLAMIIGIVFLILTLTLKMRITIKEFQVSDEEENHGRQ